MTPDRIDTIGRRAIWHLQKAGDGLSLDHLSAILVRIQRSEIESALQRLIDQDLAVLCENGWYYLLDDSFFKPQPDENTMSETTEKPKSIPAKLRDWFEALPIDSEPVMLSDLAEQLNTNKNTLGKALSHVCQEYRNLHLTELAERLNYLVMRTHPAAMATAITIKAHPSIPASTDWIEEFRARIFSKRLPESAVQWQETLTNLESVFAELGIDVDHRSRVHLRELAEWLSSTD
jgi:predicted transcriptional regulator